MGAPPARGSEVRSLGLPLPPERMRIWRRGLLKRWRYVGVYGPELMLCVGEARIGPVPQRWWAVAERGGALRQATSLRQGGVRFDGSRVKVDSADVRIRLELEDDEGVEVVTPVGDRGAYIWTRKQAGIPLRGTVLVAGRERPLDAQAFVDDSAGYYARRTAWRWSAGNGRLDDGRSAWWNLVSGVHDSPQSSERTMWVAGEPNEVGPVAFADDLSRVSFAEGGALEFREWCTREASTNLLVVRSAYRQPFGSFAGELPGGLRLAEGYGVMEEHDVLW